MTSIELQMTGAIVGSIDLKYTIGAGGFVSLIFPLLDIELQNINQLITMTALPENIRPLVAYVMPFYILDHQASAPNLQYITINNYGTIIINYLYQGGDVNNNDIGFPAQCINYNIN